MSKKEKSLKTMNSNLNSFSRRHIGIDQKVSAEMLEDIGFSSMDDFIQSIVPNFESTSPKLRIVPSHGDEIVPLFPASSIVLLDRSISRVKKSLNVRN